MMFSINQTDFSNAVSAAAKVSGGVADHAFSSHIKLIATESRVEAVGTNLERMVIAEAPALVTEQGQLLVPGKLLGEIMSSFTTEDDEPVTLERVDDHLIVKAPRVRYDLRILGADDFPPVPVIARDPEDCLFPRFEISSSSLLPMLRQVGIAAGDGNDPSAVDAVALKFEEGHAVYQAILTAAATDSKRAAVMGIECPGLPKKWEGGNLLLPRKAAEDVCRSIAALPDCQVKVFSTKSQVGFGVGPITVITRLIDRKFPNIERVFPKEHKGSFRFQADDMIKGLKSARAVAVSSMVSFDVNQVFGDVCHVEAENAERGSAKIAMPIKIDQDSAAIKIAFNLKYLEGMLGMLKGKELICSYTTSAYPAEFAQVDDQSPRPFRYVVMPMTW